MTAAAIEQLRDLLGPKGLSEDPAEIAPHLEEWRSKYKGRSRLLLKPASTEQVSRAVAICNDNAIALVAQGGNTGLVGGQIPFNDEAILSFARLNRVRTVDTGARVLIAEAGVVLEEAHRAADAHDLLFPLRLASEGSCMIGGNVSTNAGGTEVLRYGMMRELVLGLEVVLADGRVLDLLRTLRKDNTGYDLKQIFIGAEGTLGIVTAAALKLFPKPKETATAFVAVPSPAAAIGLLSQLQLATGGLISAFELLPRLGLELVVRHINGTRDPLAVPSPWYVLIEATAGAASNVRSAIESGLSASVGSGLATDATIAASEAQRSDLWAVRENMSEAQKREGASIKHDISVPISVVPRFLAETTEAVLKIVPGARPVPFGHLGDGNIHFNFSTPEEGDAVRFLAQWDAVQYVVHESAHKFGGSFSAEHGIGVMKRDDLARYKSAAEIQLMRSLKKVLDPKNLLNPGKVLPE